MFNDSYDVVTNQSGLLISMQRKSLNQPLWSYCGGGPLVDSVTKTNKLLSQISGGPRGVIDPDREAPGLRACAGHALSGSSGEYKPAEVGFLACWH